MGSLPKAVTEGFSTTRLRVHNWVDLQRDATQRAALEAGLGGVLTPRVLQHLPPSLASLGAGGVAQWMQDRLAESVCLVVQERHGGAVVGLLILAQPDASGPNPQVHIGYLLSEASWGNGYATELVRGLVAAAKDAILIGGVGKDNPASASVLLKAGFRRSEDRSSDDTDVFVWSHSD